MTYIFIFEPDALRKCRCHQSLGKIEEAENRDRKKSKVREGKEKKWG